MTVVSRTKAPSHKGRTVSNKKDNEAASRLQEILRGNRRSAKGGTYAVCSAHPAVIEAAVRQSKADRSLLHIESTSSQVNQFGGYTGVTPAQFREWILSVAKNAGLAAEQILLGGDHLGPFPWRNEASISALEKACKLVRDCIAAGYQKIHLDASMACADDPKAGLPESTIAARAAILCQAAEQAHRELPSGSPQPLYVVGTEVPAPGGESNDTGAPVVTKAKDVHRTLKAFHSAFREVGLESAWQRVIALVVQPGVDFGSNSIFDYQRAKAATLSSALTSHPGIVFEAHSTDYQSSHALTLLVEDHFAILKVGPWLTFAYREAVLALSATERELFGRKSGVRLSQVREALEAAMLSDPSHWRSYYHGNEDEVRRDRIFGYSDRCRYYWNQPAVKEEVRQLLDNLRSTNIPLTLVSQYFPVEYEAVRAAEVPLVAELLIESHIRRVLRIYAEACVVSRQSSSSLGE
jgi:D-tagatose-1,6-bisphosphate aldolase subunit GatZ/KbaZ